MPIREPSLRHLFDTQRKKIVELEMLVQSQANHIKTLELEIKTLRSE